jgi:hypothetical protein
MTTSDYRQPDDCKRVLNYYAGSFITSDFTLIALRHQYYQPPRLTNEGLITLLAQADAWTVTWHHLLWIITLSTAQQATFLQQNVKICQSSYRVAFSRRYSTAIQ